MQRLRRASRSSAFSARAVAGALGRGHEREGGRHGGAPACIRQAAHEGFAHGGVALKSLSYRAGRNFDTAGE